MGGTSGGPPGQGLDLASLFGGNGGGDLGFPVPEQGWAGGNMGDQSLTTPAPEGQLIPGEEPWDDQVVASTPTPEPGTEYGGGGGRHRRRNRRAGRLERRRNRFFDHFTSGLPRSEAPWNRGKSSFPQGRR